MSIKTNLPSILTTLLLTLTVGILFWYGKNKIKEAGNINSTIVAWENLQNDLNDSSNLNLTIQNITSSKTTYQIDWLLNNEKIDSTKIELKTGTIKTVQPTKKVLTKLMELSKNKKEVLYQVKINWNNKTETLGKWLKY